MTEVFGKLAPSASVEAVGTEIRVISERIHADHPEAYDAGAGYRVAVTPLKTQLTARARPTLLLLFATAFFVLVIACANLANLTLTRVLRRDHELAVRVSLGGGRGALRRQLLAESLILAVAGAALGLLMASVSIDLIVGFAERFTSRASEIALDGAVFGYALAAGVAASAFFTMLPPLPDGVSVGATLTRGGSRSTGGSAGKRLQRVLVVAQIATSFVLLIGAGLLMRTMLHLNSVDPGFDTSQVLTMDIPANEAGKTGAEVRDQYQSILADVQALPGVAAASLANVVPLTGLGGVQTPRFEVDVSGFEPMSGAPAPRADFRVVSPDFFETMGIDVLNGRSFVSTDLEDSQSVVIINESMAEAYFPDRDPIGLQIAWSDPLMRFLGVSHDMRTVVGVVADTRDYGLDRDIVHVMYNPYPQIRWVESLVVRAQNPELLLPAIRETILSHDPNQPIDGVATIAELSSNSVAAQRLNALLLGAFAALAMLIAAVGIGGVLAFSVGSRVREFGVRSALGAGRHQIWSGVLGEGALLAGTGLAIGTAAALGLTRFISGLLVGVPAFDPVTYITVALLLACVAMLACWLPAWRAAHVSPLEALTSE
jgi:predicted permease